MESPSAYRRPRRRTTSPLPPAKVRPFKTQLTELTGFGRSLVEQLQNKATAGCKLYVLEQAGWMTNSDGTQRRVVLYLVQDGGRSLGHFRQREQAVAHAQQLLEQRDWGGWRVSDNDLVTQVYGRKGGPELPQLSLVVDDGRAVIGCGDRLAGVLPEKHQRLLVHAMRAGQRFTVQPEINPTAPGALTVGIVPRPAA